MSTTTTNYEIRTSPDGKSVILSVQEDSKKANVVTIHVDSVATVVVGLLGACIDCARRAGTANAPVSEDRDLENVPFVHARGVGLYDVPEKPNVIGLSVIFGQTEVGIGLPREAAGPLGQALLASTADTSRRQ